MLMRFVTIADSLWTFYFVTGWVKSQRYRAGGFLPQAHGPSSTICRTSFHLNNKWLPSSFFPPPLLHRGASAPHMFLRSEKRNGHQPRRRIVVSHCKALPRVYGLHHPTDCHEPSGSTENLLCDPKLKCFRLSLTPKGLKSSFILSSCAGIEKPRHPVFLKEQKDTEKYFHAGLIPLNEKKFSAKEQGPDIDFISRICSYGCILAIDGCQIRRRAHSVIVTWPFIGYPFIREYIKF